MAGATIGPDSTIFDLNIDAFRKVVDLNLFGTVLPTMVFADVMANQREGAIVNFSSESALRPLTRVVGYGAAKAAISNLTKYLAGELAIKFGEGLRVNAIAPGFFLTEQNRTLMTNPDGSYTPRAESVIAHTPFRRLGTPDELFGTIQYLISDASKFVTGTIAIVDGGLMHSLFNLTIKNKTLCIYVNKHGAGTDRTILLVFPISAKPALPEL